VRENPIYDLAALVIILAATVTLVLAGMPPEALAAVAITLTSLFAAWLRRTERRGPAAEGTNPGD
jgi:hypothetical protein